MKHWTTLLMIAALAAPAAVAAAAGPRQPAAACTAANATQLARCADRAREGTVDTIRITAPITCGRRAPTCLDLRGVRHPLAVEGVGARSGLRRVAGYRAGPAVRIEGAHGIVLRNLVLDETPVVHRTMECTVSVVDSRDVVLERLRVRHAKLCGVGVAGGEDITVRASHFEDAQVHGLWTPNYDPPRRMRIEGNVFDGAWSNGAYVSAIASVVAGNTFRGNHRRAVYGTSGGQLLVGAGTRGLLVTGNTIAGGRLGGKWVASGIEFAEADIYGVDVAGNVIEGHDGWGIAFNHGNVRMGGVQVRGNRFARNRLGDLDYAGGYVPLVAGNCSGRDGACASAG